MSWLKRVFHRLRSANRPDHGQGLVEFALVFPLLIVVIFVMLELGLYFMTYLTVQNASREGARMASTLIDLEEDDSRVISFVEGLIPTDGPLSGFAGGTTNTAVSDCDVSDLITVTVAGEYDFVALNFLGLNGLDLSFPTTTHYELCGAYTGSSYTATPPSGNTATATNIPANTNTPTSTFTPTATATSSCPVVGGTLQYDGDDLRWNLTNTGGSTERIVSVYFDWVDDPYYNYYDRMYLAGNYIHGGDDYSPPSFVSGGWYGWGSDRDIGASQTKELNIDFGYFIPSYGASIIVTFDSGCVVSTSGGGSASNTPTSTNTPPATNTPTPSNTPTQTLTPSTTPTTASCNFQSISAYYYGDSLVWNFKNNGSSTERISSVSFDWVDNPYYNYYDRMYFGGNLIHEGDDSSPPTTVSGGWYGSGFRRDIDPGETLQLDIDFAYNLSTYGASITVQFESGCSIHVP